MYEFENMSFRFREHIFTDFTGCVADRRIGVVGQNGAGKTTLLKLLDGQLRPQAGEVRVPGDTYLVDFELRKYKSFHPADLLDLCAGLRSFDLSDAPRLSRLLRLDGYMDLPLGELSKGVNKKVALLLGLLSTAAVLLVDEPFESIDAESNRALIDIFGAQDRGLVVVSHDISALSESVESLHEVKDGGLQPIW